MKKILEVLQYGEFDIRFNTDIDVMKNPALAQHITIKSALTDENRQQILELVEELNK